MLEIKLNKGIKKTRVLVYDDTEMPVKVFQIANKYWMLDDQLGSGFKDIEEKHLKKIAFVAGDKERVLDSVKKLSTAVHLILSEINVESMAFASTIFSIDGKEVIDRSEEGLTRLLDDLSDKGLTMALVKKKTSEKSFMQTLKSIFQPNLRIQYLSEAG